MIIVESHARRNDIIAIEIGFSTLLSLASEVVSVVDNPKVCYSLFLVLVTDATVRADKKDAKVICILDFRWLAPRV